MAAPPAGSNISGSFSLFQSSAPSPDAYAAARALQPFLTANSPGGMAAGVVHFGGSSRPLPMRVGFPFAPVQWQELQRQALIYKHIVSSVPVPPALLHTVSAGSFPDALRNLAGPNSNLMSTNTTDREPGRCRRTDGKKWRCSKDVAPDQKNYERHMHRGRPRSRKHVELKIKPAATPTITTNPTTKAAANQSTIVTLSKGFPQHSAGLFSKADLKLPFQSMEGSNEPRNPDWMKDDVIAPNHQWELMNSNSGNRSSSTSPILQHYEQQLNLNYNNDGDRLCSVSNGGELPLSTLSLSMPSGIDQRTYQIQMGLGLSDSQPLSWMAPVSPLGGPLAEVLQFGTPTSAPCHHSLIDLMNKSYYGNLEASPQDSPAKLASSPSGFRTAAAVAAPLSRPPPGLRALSGGRTSSSIIAD